MRIKSNCNQAEWTSRASEQSKHVALIHLRRIARLQILAHSLDSESGGLEVPIIRTPRAKKALTTTSEKPYAPPEKRTLSTNSAMMTTWHTIRPL